MPLCGVVAASFLVLGVEPGNPKALFRRGRAHFEMSSYQSAKHDLLQAAKLQPNNRYLPADGLPATNCLLDPTGMVNLNWLLLLTSSNATSQGGALGKFLIACTTLELLCFDTRPTRCWQALKDCKAALVAKQEGRLSSENELVSGCHNDVGCRQACLLLQAPFRCSTLSQHVLCV